MGLKKIKQILSFMLTISFLFGTACGGKGDDLSGNSSIGSLHTHQFTVKKTEQQYLKSAATCGSEARYFYICECGQVRSKIFMNTYCRRIYVLGQILKLMGIL